MEKYYGPGKMLYVAERLMTSCDEAVRKLIEEWEEHRTMILKVHITLLYLLCYKTVFLFAISVSL